MFDFLNERGVGDVFEVEIGKLTYYEEKIFGLYEGERLNEMVLSVKQFGIVTPIIVREKNGEYQVLSGNNRVNAAKIAGLRKVPVYNMGKISDDEAVFIVTESNVNQRGFMELKVSERARCVAVRHAAMKRQGFRSDLIDEVNLIMKDHDFIIPFDRENPSKIFELSPSTIRRYLKLDQLVDELKELVDLNVVKQVAGVNCYFMEEDNQRFLASVLNEKELGVNKEEGGKLRELERDGVFSEENILKILNADEVKVKPYKMALDMREEYFAGMSNEEIDEVLRQALDAWYGRSGEEAV